MELTQSAPNAARPFKRVPGPLALPVLGTLHLYKLGVFNVLEYHKVLQRLYETYGPIVREKIGLETLVHVFDPDDAKAIYQNEGKMPHVMPLQETAQLYRQKADMSLGLGNVNGEEWYRLRAAVRHLMLRPKDVQHFLPAAHRVTLDLVARLHRLSHRHPDAMPSLAGEIAKWSQESAGMVCFDKRLGYLVDGPVQRVIEDVIEANKTVFYLSGLLKFSLPIYKYLPTPKWKKLVEAEDVVVRTGRGYIEEALASVERLVREERLTGDRFTFLLSLLSKPELTRKDITSITLSLFTDGLSTTVPTVLHNLYCLATNRGVQERARQEVDAVLGDDDEITPARLARLNYVKAVVKETFRMYPNGTEISRILQNDHVLSQYHIPAQTNVSINMGVHFRSEKYFSDPDTFRPERWLRGEKSDETHPYLLTPFGLGTRTCAGRRFAEQDMYLLLALIVRHFELSYSGPPLRLQYNTLLMPAFPLHIRFVPRHAMPADSQ